MIVPMLKYTMLVFYKEYNSFLAKLQELGVLHVVEKEQAISEKLKQKYSTINQYERVIQFLQTREPVTTTSKPGLNTEEIVHEIISKQQELEKLKNSLDETEKDYNKTLPWGNFSSELLGKLKEIGIKLKFYSTSKKKFTKLLNAGEPVEIISEQGNQTLFVFIQTSETIPQMDLDIIELPQTPILKLESQLLELRNNISSLNSCIDQYAANSIQLLEKNKNELIEELAYQKAIANTTKEADDKLMILEGWVPKPKNLVLNQYLEKHEILYITRKATPEDKIPVLLKNNRFSKLFEPIGSMFSLPDYAELDLTVFFAPFFMLFFGFCLGDAGYGLLFIIGAGIYKLKAKTEHKPYLSLIQLLGLATIIFGTISGTFFGVNLIETEIALTDNFRNLFLNPDKMFNLSLILGCVQIIFGLFIRAANQAKQFGFSYALATCGWLVILLGGITYTILTSTAIIPKNNTILYAILLIGGFFVLFFSDPSGNIFARLGKGVWDIYSTVTGIFGDLLSYIRLFALGLSSAILGFVINDIGLQILGSSKVLGPVFFAIFLLLGHTLNILISSLGSFVHPMRLTFVEFYKNAGFKGGSQAYKPFKKHN